MGYWGFSYAGLLYLPALFTFGIIWLKGSPLDYDLASGSRGLLLFGGLADKERSYLFDRDRRQ